MICEKPTLIYALIDPRDGSTRYVGKTIRGLATRLRAHLCRTNLTPKRHSSRWLKGLSDLGLKPSITLLEVVDLTGNWQERERFWIAYYREQGANLTNLTDGGEGVAGYEFPDERRKAHSRLMKGRIFDAEWKAKISAAKKGKKANPKTPEAKAKWAASYKATVVRRAVERTHCANGHPWIAENLTGVERGKPACLRCKSDYFKRTYVPNPQTREQRAAALEVIRRQPGFTEKLSEAAKRRVRKAA